MDKSQESNTLLMDFLKDAFPGRSDEQISPIGLIYAGVRWGKDNRYGEAPKDKQGNWIYACYSEDKYRVYLKWLADHLYHLAVEPNEEQRGLCKYVDNMEPEDGIQLIAMNTALYQLDTEMMELWIEEKATFSDYSDHLKNNVIADDEDYDEESERKLYERVGQEMIEQRHYCPNVRHADVSYRVPLSIVLKKAKIKRQRIELLKSFYTTYNEYIRK